MATKCDLFDLSYYRAWVALSELPGIGCRTSLKLLQHFDDDPFRCLSMSVAEMQQLRLPDKTVDAVRAYQSGCWPEPRALEQISEWLAETDHHILTLGCGDYPALLREISDPPLLLYVKGSITALHLPQIAIIGSRSASRNGMQVGNDFARALSEAGIVVTSGLARGIDGVAHSASVELGRPTVAVLGSGLANIYPKQHFQLAQGIVECDGALVSEYPLNMAPLPHNFPRRNRIISGLSAGVLVVEATQRSGSLITARLALEQGREVFALPGALNNPQSHGCHTLIREGAQLVETTAHIIESLGAILAGYQIEELRPEPESSHFSAEEAWLLEYMGYEICTLETLVDRTGRSTGELMSLLVAMELKGFIARQPEGYIRCV